jgi:hypothetical protein
MLRKDHGCGGDRARKWPPTRLVNTGDPKTAAGTEGGFEG